jgi:hypothetical protein
VALCSLILLDRELVGSEDLMDLPVVARAESSCWCVIRISMAMPFLSTVIAKHRVIELFIIVIGLIDRFFHLSKGKTPGEPKISTLARNFLQRVLLCICALFC